MAARSDSSPDPWHWHLSVDDVGEFDLWVVPEEGTLPGGPCAGLRWTLSLPLQSGPRWQLRPGVGESPILRWREPGSERVEEPTQIDLSVPTEFWLGPRRVRSRRPAEGSAALQWVFEGGLPGVPEAGLLLLPKGHHLSLGPRRAAIPVEDWARPITLSAGEDGLQLHCEGGVRMAREGAEFDDPEPTRRLSQETPGTVQFWCVARPGPPVFLTLQRQFHPGGGPAART